MVLGPSCRVVVNCGTTLLVRTLLQSPSSLKVALTGPVMPVAALPLASVTKVLPFTVNSMLRSGCTVAGM